MSKSEIPEIEILYRNLRYGKKLLQEENRSATSIIRIQNGNNEIQAAIEHIENLHNENEMLKANLYDIGPKEIIKHQDIDQLLEAIGPERVGAWFMGLGSR